MRVVLMLRVAVVTVATLLGAACGSTSVTDVTAPGRAACAVNAALPQQTMAADGGSTTLSIAAERDCVWNASSDVPWALVNPISGNGSATVTLTAIANPSSSSRTGAVVVNDVRLVVDQAGRAVTPSQPNPNPPPNPGPVTCNYQVAPSAVAVGASGGTGQIAITTGGGCAWTSQTSAGWISITAGQNGTGPGSVRFSVAEHKGKGSRTGSLAIAGQTIVVTQAGRT